MTLEHRVAKLESDMFGLQSRSSARLSSYDSLDIWLAVVVVVAWFLLGVQVGTSLTLRRHGLTECETTHQEKSAGARGPDQPGHDTPEATSTATPDPSDNCS
jgi:hypothetical protein